MGEEDARPPGDGEGEVGDMVGRCKLDPSLKAPGFKA